MNVVVAMDSFKGSLTSLEAGQAIREGICRVYPDADVQVRPLADGGEGTAEALTLGMGGTLRQVTVTGPLGTPVTASYGVIPGRRTAILEMAAAAGLPLVPLDQRNPLKTTTWGLGEMICDAIRQGCRHFLIGIGGSATNDGGIGMLQALGYQLLDSRGCPVCAGAQGLADLADIRAQTVLPQLKDCTFRIACDVTNPLCGPAGASAIYGPQKGATPWMVEQMDGWLRRFSQLALEKGYPARPDDPGAGAAGGLGFAFRTFLRGELKSGVQVVLEETRLASCIQKADLVVTGEGRLDAQTAMGKAPAGVSGLARSMHKPVIAFSGCVTRDAGLCNQFGIDAFFPILRFPQTLEQAMQPGEARENLIETVEQVFRLIRTARGLSGC